MSQIRLGLCCINTELRNIKPKKNQVFCSRSCTRSTFTVDKAIKLSIQNIKDIVPMVKWNNKHNVSLMRLTSDFFPHYTDDATESYNLDFSHDVFNDVCSQIANLTPHRFTMHPGQYCCLGSPTQSVIKKTCEDLKMHAHVLDCLSNVSGECDVINIHGGGIYGDKESAIRRWCENFDDLPRTVKNKLTIENDEKSYSINDCFEISDSCNIPIVFDIFHHLCYNLSHGNPTYKYETDYDLEFIIEECIQTWDGDRVPLFHLSEQRKNSKIGSHSDLIDVIPSVFIKISNKYKIDIDIEAKLKEQAILKLYSKYSNVFKFS